MATLWQYMYKHKVHYCFEIIVGEIVVKSSCEQWQLLPPEADSAK